MFPAYTHSVLQTIPEEHWLIQAQGVNECGCTTPANALNLLNNGEKFYDKDQLVRESGLWFQRRMGGTPSFVTEMLLKRHGAGTHFGNLSKTNGEQLLRDLIDQNILVCIEFGGNRVGPFTIYGEHAVLLVGYSDPFVDAAGVQHEEYYVVDAAYRGPDGTFGLHTNNIDHDGDGVSEYHPGNRTVERRDFWASYPTGIYFPVFPSQIEHDHWYAQHIRRGSRWPVIGALRDRLFTGSFDYYLG
jgi:hypothetical protein